MTETKGHTRKPSETKLQTAGDRGPASVDSNLSYKEKQNPATETLQAEAGFESLEEIDAKRRKLRRRRCFCCCFSCLGILVALVIIIVVLALTVFKLKDPKIALNSMTLDGFNFELVGLQYHANLTLISDMSVKNQNKVASFKHNESTTLIFYRGATVGQTVMPAGTLKSDRTVRMNVTTTVYLDVIASSIPDLLKLVADVMAGNLAMTTRTVMPGRVTLLHIIKKHVTVHVECIINVNVINNTATTDGCKQSYKL